MSFCHPCCKWSNKAKQMSKGQCKSIGQEMACAEISQGKTSSATVGQADPTFKAAAIIAARKATWSQSAVLARGISKVSAQWHMAPQQLGHTAMTGLLTQAHPSI